MIRAAEARFYDSNPISRATPLIGLVTAIGAVRVMQSMLFEVKPLDAAVFASVGCGLLVVFVAASLIPALRTVTIDPAQALRAE